MMDVHREYGDVLRQSCCRMYGMRETLELCGRRVYGSARPVRRALELVKKSRREYQQVLRHRTIARQTTFSKADFAATNLLDARSPLPPPPPGKARRYWQ